MELQQLRYVTAVAEVGNFTRASERCNVSQPSLSQQIMNLEKELGHKLFHRLGRRAVLTEAGTIFLDRAQRILFEVESATKEMSDSPALERRITVGAIPTLAPFLLPSLIVRCKKRYPNLQINVQEDFKQNLLRAVLEGEIDLAIVALPIEESRVHVESLLKEPLLLAMGKNHPLAARTAVASADLADQNFVLLGTSSSLTAQVKSFCGDHNFDPKISFRCSQVATVKALLSLGTSVSILPQVVRGPEDEGTLTYVKLSDAEPFREIGVIRHMQRYQSRGAEQFLTLLREWARELAGA
jgi:LysR family hydrogen peroxide-inducible transcriptional activator